MHVKQWGSKRDHQYVELNNLDHRGSTVSQRYPDLPWYERWSMEKWRFVVQCGVATSVVVLVANLSVLIAGLRDRVDLPGTRILYKGSCETSSKTYTAWHILINILSTLLLGASNATSQILAAPTRAEIDDAHSRGKYVHIGVFDFLNLKYVTLKRIVLCGLIAISSIPLHLLYNSTIYNTTAIFDYYAIMVAPPFLTGQNFTLATEDDGSRYSDYTNLPTANSAFDDDDPAVDQDLKDLQQQAQNGSLIRLENRECILQFGVDIVNNYSAVLVVTKESPKNTDNPYLGAFKYSTPKEMVGGIPNLKAYDWVCDGQAGCDPQKWASQPVWSMSAEFHGAQSPSGSFTVDHCLVRPVEGQCSVELSVYLMLTVIVCNAVKLFCFLSCLTIKDYKPIVTVGDAVCSFLAQPDPTSVGLGPVSSGAIRGGAWHVHQEAVSIAKQRFPGRKLVFPGQLWKNRRHKFFAAVGVGRWISTAIICGIIFVTGFALLSVGTTNNGWGVAAFASKFNFTSQGVLSGNFNLFSAVFSANILQLAISNAYLLYNGIFTCVLLSSELADYATEAKTMRVTRPHGAQRSTYWLQLPYRWGLPLMAAMALLHWLVSEAIFMVDIQVLDPNGKKEVGEDKSFYGLAWGPTATLLAVIEGGLMIAFLFINGFRKFPAGIPVLSSSSVAISAACHPSRLEYDDAVVRPLKYGVLETDSYRDPKPTGFSAREVAPLQNGEVYGGTPDLEDDEPFAESKQIRAPSPLLKNQASSFTTAGDQHDLDVASSTDEQTRARSRPGRKISSTHKFL